MTREERGERRRPEAFQMNIDSLPVEEKKLPVYIYILMFETSECCDIVMLRKTRKNGEIFIVIYEI